MSRRSWFGNSSVGARLLAITATVLPAVGFATPFTETILANHNPDQPSNNYFDTSLVQHLQTGSTPPAASSASQARSGAWGDVGGSATANLATGQLGGRAYANFTGSSDSLYMQMNAFFGDGFRTFDASGPFSWQPNSTARFSLDVAGTLTSSPSLATLGAGAFVFLGIYQPNTLDANSNLIGTPNLLSYYLYLLGNPNQSLSSCDFNGNCSNLLPTRFVGDLNNPVSIVQDFNPGGDFDWALLLGASGQVSVPGGYDMDLSHTVTFNYEGPAGTRTESESGLFSNYTVPPTTTTTVPEPSSLLIAVMGLLGIGFSRTLAARR